MSLCKWDLAWAGLDPAQGHEHAGRRPVLLFCNDAIAPPIGLVSVLPLTTWKKGRRIYPTEVLLQAGTAGLDSPSLVLCHQIRTLAASRLFAPFGHLAQPGLRQAVNKALALWLDLGPASILR